MERETVQHCRTKTREQIHIRNSGARWVDRASCDRPRVESNMKNAFGQTASSCVPSTNILAEIVAMATKRDATDRSSFLVEHVHEYIKEPQESSQCRVWSPKLLRTCVCNPTVSYSESMLQPPRQSAVDNLGSKYLREPASDLLKTPSFSGFETLGALGITSLWCARLRGLVKTP